MFFYKIACMLYAPKSQEFILDWAEVYIPLEYGVLNDPSQPLPHATRLCLRAVGTVTGPVAYACDTSLDRYSSIADAKGEIHNSVIVTSCTNSVTEARNIKDKLSSVNFFPQKIQLVCDALHARRVRLIWQHYYPGAEIRIKTVKANWNEDHRSPRQRSPIKWLITNLAGHLLVRLHLSIYGDLEGLTRITQVGNR